MHLPLATPAGPPTEGVPLLGDASVDAARTAPQRLVAWAFERFRGRRLVVTTGFGMEGCAMLDMVAALGGHVEVHWIDTSFLFPEILELRTRLARRYPRLEFVRHATSISPEQQAALHGPELWTRDPDLCCRLRKVEPMAEILSGADAWMTAVRREQSAHRASLDPVAWDPVFELVKISPLVTWSRADVWEHVRRHEVPYNPLHDRGYPSLGCVQCTSAVEGSRPEDYSRDGRWLGRGKTECGLHQRPQSTPTTDRTGASTDPEPTDAAGRPGAQGSHP